MEHIDERTELEQEYAYLLFYYDLRKEVKLEFPAPTIYDSTEMMQAAAEEEDNNPAMVKMTAPQPQPKYETGGKVPNRETWSQGGEIFFQQQQKRQHTHINDEWQRQTRKTRPQGRKGETEDENPFALECTPKCKNAL